MLNSTIKEVEPIGNVKVEPYNKDFFLLIDESGAVFAHGTLEECQKWELIFNETN